MGVGAQNRASAPLPCSRSDEDVLSGKGAKKHKHAWRVCQEIRRGMDTNRVHPQTADSAEDTGTGDQSFRDKTVKGHKDFSTVARILSPHCVLPLFSINDLKSDSVL
jgi:hypothetical protein